MGELKSAPTLLSRVQAGTGWKITGVRRVHSVTKCFLSAELTDKTKQNNVISDDGYVAPDSFLKLIGATGNRYK